MLQGTIYSESLHLIARALVPGLSLQPRTIDCKASSYGAKELKSTSVFGKALLCTGNSTSNTVGWEKKRDMMHLQCKVHGKSTRARNLT